MNNSNDWSRGEQWILFPENLNISLDLVSGNIDVRGKQIHFSSRDKSLNDLISDFCYSAKQNKSTFEKRAEFPGTTSGHFQVNALIRFNNGQHFTGNS